MGAGGLALALALSIVAAPVRAAGSGASGGGVSLRFCDQASRLTAGEQDRLLRFAAVAHEELARVDGEVALVARSGLDLARFDVRYSHAGLALRDSENGPWSVRQLYFACDEGRPRLFDQGLGGFVSGTDDPSLGYLSIVVLRGPDAQALAREALDRRAALALVGGRYSANAYPYSTRYQNCNQWVAELMAQAWSPDPQAQPADGTAAVADATPRLALSPAEARDRAQAWLRHAGYRPEAVQVGSHALKFAAGFVPWIHLDDHPEADRYGLVFEVSLPTALERFVRGREPQAERIELCHDEARIVVRHGWEPMGTGCVPAPGDRVQAL